MAIFSFLTWPLALMGLIVVGFRTMMNDVDDPIGHRMLGPRTITPVYDFIIVGGGTSGAVLANRLTEDPDTRVLLLEAGSDGSYLSEVPAFPFLLWNTEMDWHYFSEPQSDSCLAFQGSRCVWFRGKMLGGSSALNGGVYARGNPKDYDNWERLGNSGWSWQDVFPLFRKSEDFKKRDNRGGIDDEFHGTGGYMPTSRADVYTKLFDQYVKAGEALGYAENDYNGKNQTGFAFLQTYNKDGVRYSTATGYLRPIIDRDNLEIMVMSRATKVLVDPAHDRAVGVSFRRAGRDYDVLASKEVIVSAGVVESPKLLMLSGIGPADELRRLGIHVSKDLPGVGKNMRSHVGAGGIYFTTSQPVGMSLFRDLTIRSLASYAFRGGGQLNSPGGLEGIAFISSNYSTDPTWPDVEILFGSTHIASDGGLVYRRLLNLTEEVWETYRDLRWRDGFMMLPFPTRPKSRGQIRLRSANPEEDPEIIGNYFKHPEDMQITVDAIKFLMKIAETPAMKEVGAELYAHTLPGCEQHTRFSDAYWECHTRHFTYLHWHDSSTCQMGPEYNPETVVDSRLRVHGINSLRVADASIMPEIVSGDTQAACIMIGEKAASMIKEDHQLLTARSRLLRI